MSIEQTPSRLTFTEYQERSAETAIYPGAGENLLYPLLGLVGEVGEVVRSILGSTNLISVDPRVRGLLEFFGSLSRVAEVFKKVYRDNASRVVGEYRRDLDRAIDDTSYFLDRFNPVLDGVAADTPIRLDHPPIGGVFIAEDPTLKELGDCLWYLARLAETVSGPDGLADAASGNLTKLESRMARGTLGGSGDER